MTLRRVLVELTTAEHRYRAVLEVQAGVPVTEVAERFGVSRQAVHPQPASEPVRVQRRVDSRGAFVAAGQKIQIGIRHAGHTLDVEEADTTWRVHDGDQLLADVPRTTTKTIARFKVRKPEPPRQRRR